ncbi:hypothetical protein PG997_012363 [Apiospora hydei]|uniref:F-box domain-containing protein n=1 Tax=Apiospora hydei TaxID=1337664 RepID=A0ABR1V5Q0_9PEZI
MTTPFLALPTELATAIVTHLDVSDLLRLSKTCKNLHAFAQPFLLDTVTLAYNPAALPNQSRPFASLLRLLVRNNGAASFLRHLQLVCPETAEVVVAGPLSLGRNGWWDENRLLFEGVLEDLQMPDRDRWRHALRDGDTRALIALALAYCVELESLEAASNILFLRDGAGDNWLLRMFRHLLGVRSLSTTSFEKLRRIMISTEHWNDENNSISPEDISWWHRPEFKAEVMRDRASSSKEWGWSTPQWKQAGEGENFDLAASRLRTLHIRLQYAPEAALETILAAIPSLHTLHIELNKPSTTTPIDCPAIQRALRHVEPTLEDLKLTADLFGDEACDVQNLGRVVGGRIGGGDGGLSTGFPALKSLHTSLPLLFGQEASGRYVLSPGDTDWWSDDEDGDEVKGIKSVDDPYHDMMLIAAAELAGLLPRGLEVLTINDDLWFYDALPAWSGGKRTLGMLMAFATGSPISPRVTQGLSLPRLHTSVEVDAGVAAGCPWRTATPRLRALNVSFRDENTWCWADEPGTTQVAHLQWGCARQGLECRALRSRAPGQV